jgi:hypothetical protein
MIVPPPTPDNVYTISAAVVDGNGEQADQTLNGSYTVAADKTPLVLQGKLPKSLTITPEITGDYVQFTYGDLSWRSDTKGGSPGYHTTIWAPDPQFPGFPVSPPVKSFGKNLTNRHM